MAKYTEIFEAGIRSDPVLLRDWQSFTKWASLPLQWAQMFVPHWMEIPFSPLHSDMMKLMYDGLLGRIPHQFLRTALLSPRTHGKSTCAKIVALMIMTEAVANGDYKPREWRDFDLFYVTSEGGLAKDTFLAILDELERNERILSQYGKLKVRVDLGPPLDIKLSNGMRISSRSVGGTLRGHHPAMGMFDDIQGEDNISSDEMREKFTNFYETVIRQMFIPHQTYSVFTGNRMHIFDTYGHVARQKDTLTVIKQALVNVGGRRVSAWPGMYSTADLLAEEKANPTKFSTEKMNNPVVTTMSTIRLEDFRWYNQDEMEEKWWSKLIRVTVTDPAARHRAINCETAIVTLGWNRNLGEPDIYVIDASMGHWSTEGILTQNYNVFSQFHPHFQGIENIGFAEALRLLTNQNQNKPAGFNLQPHDSLWYISEANKSLGDAKLARIRSVDTYFTHHRVYFNEQCPYQRRIVDQLISYSRGDKFDAGDAFCMAVNELTHRYPPQRPGSNISRPQPVRDPMTGLVIGFK